MAYKSPDEVISKAMAAEALVIAKLIVTKRVQVEEISRGRLAQTPRGLVEMFERHIDLVLEARRKPEATGR